MPVSVLAKQFLSPPAPLKVQVSRTSSSLLRQFYQREIGDHYDNTSTKDKICNFLHWYCYHVRKQSCQLKEFLGRRSDVTENRACGTDVVSMCNFLN